MKVMMYDFKMRFWRAALLAISLGTILLFVAGCCAPFIDLFMSRGPTKGEPAPDFILTALHDEQMTLSELQGRAVLIVFWSST
jgi:hypothetical protein